MSYRFQLFVAGHSQRSQNVVTSFQNLCATELPGQHRIDIVDVLEQPEIAEHHKVLATPTLIRLEPNPAVKLVGDLVNPSWLRKLIEPDTPFEAVSREIEATIQIDNSPQRGSYSQLLDLNPDGVVVVDKEGQVLLVNPAGAEMLRIDVERLRGEVFGFPLVAGETTNVVLRTGRLAELRAVATQWDDKSAFLVAFRDVTEQRQRAEELAQVNRELREKNQELLATTKALDRAMNRLEVSNQDLQDFAYAAAHDIKAPLRWIKHASAMLLVDESEKMNGESGGRLRKVSESAERLTVMIDRMLEYSHADSRSLTFARVNLADVVRRVIADLQPTIDESGCQLAVEELPTVEADQSQMYQVFLNLISNAVKFRRPDVASTIQVSLLNPSRTDNGHPKVCKIAVSDNGIGFDQRHAEVVFAPFQRLVKSEEFEGSGIGMATVKKIVERHGGSVEVTSAVGEGTTFTLTLPVFRPSEAM